MARATILRAALLLVYSAAAFPAVAGHESPFYPSFYPQEIRVETVAPEAAAAALRKGSLHAYVGADPFGGGSLPAEVRAVESLEGFLVAIPGPSARTPEARCAAAARAAAGVSGPGRHPHPYAVTPYHADYLVHADLAAAAAAAVRRAPAAAPADARVEVVRLDDLVAEDRAAAAGFPGPPWLKAGWFHAYRLQADALADPAARRRVDEMAARLMAGEPRDAAERATLERSLVTALAAGCERAVVGYVTRREPYGAEYSEGIENVAFDSQSGLGSAVFLRTAKLKDFPWNGWLRLGVSTPPAAAWNPVGGFTDPAGRLIWAAVGDPALIPDPYGGGWSPNRVVVEAWQADPGPVPAGAAVGEPGTPAVARVRYRALASLFHDGSRMTQADLIAPYLYAARWGVAPLARDRLAGLDVARVDRKTVQLAPDMALAYDVFVVDVYLRRLAGGRDESAAVAPPWSSVPWHVLALMDEAVARGLGTLSGIDLVRDQRVKQVLAGLVDRFAAEGHVPEPLRGRVTADEARARWAALRRFFRQHGHLLAANGPYLLDRWTADSAVLQVFRDLSYPLGVGTFDRFALPRRAFVSGVEAKGDRLEVSAEVERVFRYQRTYELIREPFGSAASADQITKDTLVARYVALGAEGRVLAVGEAAEPEGNRFGIDLGGLPARAVAVALVLNGNTMDPDVRVVPWTR
ncbi:MAG TPA: hypothetical protein VF406_13165 [Thermodesulfobacteriota bacterium]